MNDTTVKNILLVAVVIFASFMAGVIIGMEIGMEKHYKGEVTCQTLIDNSVKCWNNFELKGK